MARLLHLIDEFKMGGAQTHLITMLREAQKTYPHIDHEVVSLFGSGPIGKQIKEMSIKVKVFNFRYLFQDKRFLKAAAELENYIKSVEPDLVEAHLTWSRLLGLYAAWKAGVSKRIGFEQGDIYMNSLPLRLLNFGGQFVADDIIVCSHALKEWVHNTHRVFNKKLTVLHNCVDVKKFCTDGAAHANGIRDSVDTEFIFCAVGTLGTGVNKRMDINIKAIRQARRRGADVGLLICGDGEQRKELEELTAKLSLEPYVSFLGMRDDVPDVMKGCNAFCHAAPFEPFGIVCIEAMATGLPVIIPDTGGMKEAVISSENGFIYKSLDEKEMSEKMIDLAAIGSEERKRMGKKNRQRVLEHFTVEQYVKKLYQIYGLASNE